MELLKKYYIYIFEFVIGNFIFNFIYSIVKTLVLKNIGAVNEIFVDNLKNSFTETFIIYVIIYVILVIIQILYDKAIVYKLNEKLNKTKKRG